MNSTISSTENPQLHQIDLTKLNIQQLTQLKQQLDQELNILQSSLQTLKLAQTKFQTSGEGVEKIMPQLNGKSILVPLTSSMYVPGKLIDTDNVVVDIGTGYYARKSTEDAKDYFKRKVIFVTEQMEKFQMIGLEKSKIRDTIVDVMEMKLQSEVPAQN